MRLEKRLLFLGNGVGIFFLRIGGSVEENVDGGVQVEVGELERALEGYGEWCPFF